MREILQLSFKKAEQTNHQTLVKLNSNSILIEKKSVPGAGFEPARSHDQHDLSVSP